MGSIRLIGFSGEVPRAQPQQLPATGAQFASNARLENGALVPFRRSRLVRRFSEAAPGSIKSIYLHQGEWLRWSHPVNAAPGPVAQDRLYYTGDGEPKMRVAGKVYNLAVPLPGGPLHASASGGAISEDVTTRVYAYTWVTAYGEESEPSPVSNEVDWRPGQIVTLSNFLAPPTGRQITLQRVYRSQTGSSGATTLNLIAEREASDSSFIDNIGVDDFGEVIPSQDWTAPPNELSGLISLPNGIMAGFTGRDLYFCEPWHPHAWPEKYVLTTDYPIVALGAFGTSIVVATTGHPYIVSGTAPESMVMERLELNLPCINAAGMVDLGYSVAYPSVDGLVSVSSSGAQVVSSPLMSKNDWQKFNPSTFVSGQVQGRYFASYEYIDAGTVRTGSILFDLSGSTPFLIRTNATAEAVYFDVPSSTLYLLRDIEVHEFDAQGQPYESMTWRSKQFVAPHIEPSFGCILVRPLEVKSAAKMRAEATQRATIIAANAAKLSSILGGEIAGSPFNAYTVNGDVLASVPQAQEILVSLIVDGVTIYSTTALNEVRRLPAGYRGETIEIEVSGTAAISEIRLAHSMDEIAQV